MTKTKASSSPVDWSQYYWERVHKESQTVWKLKADPAGFYLAYLFTVPERDKLSSSAPVFTVSKTVTVSRQEQGGWWYFNVVDNLRDKIELPTGDSFSSEGACMHAALTHIGYYK